MKWTEEGRINLLKASFPKLGIFLCFSSGSFVETPCLTLMFEASVSILSHSTLAQETVEAEFCFIYLVNGKCAKAVKPVI